MIPININRREKLVLGAGGGFLILFFVFLFLIQPVFENRAALRQRLDSKKQQFSEILRMRDQYRLLQFSSQNKKDRYSERPADFTLFSFMDRLAGQTGLKENITYMKPGSAVDEASGMKMSYVELKMQDVTMEDLTSYLFQVETSNKMVHVTRLSISRGEGEKGLLSVVMQAETAET